ncbi:ABC transporter substrate-binding protein [Geothermobacter hydrogeniphilus]|uniref:ABC transporter permease n=1 Tax=Geothermobacter hydrogeniphilus TaxID=1969733 RepID=A0A1X0Y2A0_9BACT|nr:ABC transporter substrate-binding protein [Geothermobacter hydrogeniphilus]ORJ59290.1 ABC transporter permease [Geothermobacter hydrogeniphilus]
MSEKNETGISRRDFVIKGSVATAGLAAASVLGPASFAIGGQARVKVGILLPYTGTYAKLGTNIRDAMKLRFAEAGNKLGGREIEFVDIDSEAKPAKAQQLTDKLIRKENVDFLVGPVHSVVGMAMVKMARGKGPITVIPNAGADQLTGVLCAPNVFRTSFSSYQMGFPGGPAVLEDGHKRVVLMYWNYGFGKQVAAAFKKSFLPAGGTIVKEIPTPFPKVDFQAYLTELAALKPDAVYTFYAGGGAVKFVKDFAAAGLKKSIKLYGAGFLTEGLGAAQGDAAEGVRTILHYADTLDNPANHRFRKAFRDATGARADVYAVQGYDAGELILRGMNAVKGDTGARAEMIRAMESAEIDSPRGRLRFSQSHNPIHDIYLREVVNGENRVVRVAARDQDDPATGCSNA